MYVRVESPEYLHFFKLPIFMIICIACNCKSSVGVALSIVNIAHCYICIDQYNQNLNLTEVS